VNVGALASVAVQLFISAMHIPIYLALHYLAYDGPVPIQLIVGLLIVKSHKVPGSDSPWFNEEEQTAQATSEHQEKSTWEPRGSET
jgi:hypothetical protein